MPMYSLELEVFSLLNGSTSDFEIFADGVLLGGYSSVVSSAGSTISLPSISFTGAMPTSLEFRFNDAAPGSTDQIEVRSVIINDRYVNVGNYLSTNILNDGDTASVDITGADFVFNNSAEPDAGEFTTGATRVFTGADDTYRGFNDATDQVFNLLGGRDYAHSGDGNDKVSGGTGDDFLYGEGGNDLLFGDDGNDRLYGQDGDDTLHGGDGDDRIHGNDGEDIIHGGAGADRLNGHADDDIITGGAGDDKLSGGSGNDFLFGDGDDDQLTGGAGDDTLDGGAGNDIIYGGAGLDNIDGGNGDDIIIGNAGVDIINGGADDDTIYLGPTDFEAGEVIHGGAGTDELILSRAMTVDFTTGTIDELETLTGSDADQDVTYTIEQALQFTDIDLNGGNDTTRVSITGVVDVTALGTPTVTDVENGFLIGSAGNDDLTISGGQLDALIFGAGTIDFAGGTDILLSLIHI